MVLKVSKCAFKPALLYWVLYWCSYQECGMFAQLASPPGLQCAILRLLPKDVRVNWPLQSSPCYLLCRMKSGSIFEYFLSKTIWGIPNQSTLTLGFSRLRPSNILQPFSEPFLPGKALSSGYVATLSRSTLSCCCRILSTEATWFAWLKVDLEQKVSVPEVKLCGLSMFKHVWHLSNANLVQTHWGLSKACVCICNQWQIGHRHDFLDPGGRLLRLFCLLYKCCCGCSLGSLNQCGSRKLSQQHPKNRKKWALISITLSLKEQKITCCISLFWSQKALWIQPWRKLIDWSQACCCSKPQIVPVHRGLSNQTHDANIRDWNCSRSHRSPSKALPISGTPLLAERAPPLK